MFGKSTRNDRRQALRVAELEKGEHHLGEELPRRESARRESNLSRPRMPLDNAIPDQDISFGEPGSDGDLGAGANLGGTQLEHVSDSEGEGEAEATSGNESVDLHDITEQFCGNLSDLSSAAGIYL